jgi:hypothetical protein
MSIDQYKNTYCKECKSNECALVLNIEHNAQCVNYEKQNSK